MSSEAKPGELILYVSTYEDADDEELDRLTRQLRDELLDLDIESVDLLREGRVPSGTRSVEEAVTIGALALAILPTAVPILIESLRSWIMRGENRNVKIKITRESIETDHNPATMSNEEIAELVNALANQIPKSQDQGTGFE